MPDAQNCAVYGLVGAVLLTADQFLVTLCHDKEMLEPHLSQQSLFEGLDTFRKRERQQQLHGAAGFIVTSPFEFPT